MANLYKAVIFDLYDTLIYLGQNTDPHLRLFKDLKLSKEEIIEARTVAFTEDFKSLSDFAKRIAPCNPVDTTSYENEISKDLATATLFPETVQVLKTLRAKGLKIGLISNVSSDYISPFFKLRLDTLIDQYVMSCKIGLKKPDLRIYEEAIKRLGTKPDETIMTGDSVYSDVFGPHLAGMDAILLDRKGNSGLQIKISSLDEIISYL